MHRFHFVHSAGIHLDLPFRHIGRAPLQIRAALHEAAAAAWDDLIDFCIRKDAAFLLIAGGVFGEGGGTLTARLRMQRGIERLGAHGTRLLIALDAADAVHGDIGEEWRAAGAVVFPADRPQVVHVEYRGEVVAAVAGRSAGAASEADLAEYFSGAVDGPLRIGVAAGVADHLDQVAEQVRRQASYWALGGAALPSRRGFSPWIVQCGELQARGRRPLEPGPRGAMLAAVDGTRIVAVDHTPLDRIRYADLTVAPQHALDAPLLVHQLLDELHRLRAAHAGRGLLVDIVLQPSPTAAAGYASKALLDRLRAETAAWDPFVWCADLRCAVELPTGDQISGRSGRAIVQAAQALIANPMQRSYAFARHFEPLMRRCTAELQSGDAERLIAAAVATALPHGGDGSAE